MKVDNTCEICGESTLFLQCIWCADIVSRCTANGNLFVWEEKEL